MTLKNHKTLRQSIRGNWIFGLLIIVVCFGGLGTWAAMAPLSSAAIATGQISPDGSQRTVQHLEGGIVSELNVKEGGLVSKGMLLIVLDKAQAEANYQSKNRNLQRLKVVRDRLFAQQSEDPSFSVAIDKDLSNDQTFAQFVKNEITTFYLKRKLEKENFEIFDRQEKQVVSEISSLHSQAQGLKDQLVFINQELQAKQTLERKGLIKKPELFAVQRKQAELSSKASSIGSTIARAGQKIEEIQISKIAMRTEILQETGGELAKINAEIAQAEEAINATADILTRTRIMSPIDGRILKLNYKTIGGVVRPGEPILTIVPVNEELIVDAKLSPTDIDNVTIGMVAKIQLSSFLARHMVPINGEVIQVGADVVTDPDTREKYFSLRVRIDTDELKSANMDIELLPGMPVEVFVQTGVHTPFRYIADPIVKSFNRAFREEAMRS